MALIHEPHQLLIRYGREARYLLNTGELGNLYETATAHEIICALADICNGIGAQLRFGYQQTHGGATFHYVSIFSQEHPDWIAAFINKLITHPDVHTRTASIILSNFEIKSQEYQAENRELSWEENPTIKLGYRMVFQSLRTEGFLDSDGNELIDLNDYVDTSEVLL